MSIRYDLSPYNTFFNPEVITINPTMKMPLKCLESYLFNTENLHQTFVSRFNLPNIFFDNNNDSSGQAYPAGGKLAKEKKNSFLKNRSVIFSIVPVLENKPSGRNSRINKNQTI